MAAVDVDDFLFFERQLPNLWVEGFDLDRRVNIDRRASEEVRPLDRRTMLDRRGRGYLHLLADLDIVEPLDSVSEGLPPYPDWYTNLNSDVRQTLLYLTERQQANQARQAHLQEQQLVAEGYKVSSFHFEDPFSQEGTPERHFIDNIVKTTIGLRLVHPDTYPYKGERTAGPDNPLTVAFRGLSPAMNHWRGQLVPTSAALQVLYNPHLEKLPDITKKDKRTNEEVFIPGIPMDHMASLIFQETADGRAIRSRGAVIRHNLVDHFMDRETYPKGAEVHIASLACGAAEVVFDGIEELLRQRPDLRVVVHLADQDEDALNRAEDFAATNISLAGVKIQKYPIDITNKEELESIVQNTNGNGIDFAEAVGIIEYFKSINQILEKVAARIPAEERKKYIAEHSEKLMAKASKLLPYCAETFMSNAFALLNERGEFNAGNMRNTHPQVLYTTDGVRWPHIVPRKLETFIDMAEQSCQVEDRRNIEVVLPTDGVYAVLRIFKSR